MCSPTMARLGLAQDQAHTQARNTSPQRLEARHVLALSDAHRIATETEDTQKAFVIRTSEHDQSGRSGPCISSRPYLHLQRLQTE